MAVVYGATGNVSIGGLFLAGVVPGAFDRPAGCLLAPRCPYVRERCRELRPPLFDVGDDLLPCGGKGEAIRP